jgi:hypothetical protein
MSCDYYIYYNVQIDYLDNNFARKNYKSTYKINLYSYDEKDDKNEIKFYTEKFSLNKNIVVNDIWNVNIYNEQFHIKNCKEILQNIEFSCILLFNIKSEFYIK